MHLNKSLAPKKLYTVFFLKLLFLAIFLYTLSFSQLGLAQNGSKTILVVGDSLSAEYGLERGEGWVALLQKRLRENKLHYTVINTSVSGDTTEQGKSHLKADLIKYHPQIVILALGSNDGLRGQNLTTIRQNLTEMVQTIISHQSVPIVIGNRVPNNYGKKYAEEFYKTFQGIVPAKQTVPFMLADIAEQYHYFQADGLHPTAKAQPLILNTIWKVLSPHLK